MHQARMLATGITSDPTVFRILAPTAILGYGFPEAAWLRAGKDQSRHWRQLQRLLSMWRCVSSLAGTGLGWF